MFVLAVQVFFHVISFSLVREHFALSLTQALQRENRTVDELFEALAGAVDSRGQSAVNARWTLTCQIFGLKQNI